MTVYFDGLCNVCNGFVDFLIRRDHRRVLKYAPMQGTTARARLDARLVKDLDTMAFETDRQTYTESTAAIRAVAALGGSYATVMILLLVPRALRDLVYRTVAKNRYRWFGRRAECRLPTPEERAQFLD